MSDAVVGALSQAGLSVKEELSKTEMPTSAVGLIQSGFAIRRAVINAGIVAGADLAKKALLASPGAATSALGMLRSGVAWFAGGDSPTGATAFDALADAMEFVAQLVADAQADASSGGASIDAEGGIDPLAVVGSALQDGLALGAALPIGSNSSPLCVEFLSSLLPKVAELAVNSSLVVPCGWSCGDRAATSSHAMLLVLVRRELSYDLFVCNAGPGIGYHAAKADVRTGGVKMNLPMRLRSISIERATDPTFWFLILRPLVWPDADHGPRQLYEQLLPFLTTAPLLASCDDTSSSWNDPPSTPREISLAGGGLVMQVPPWPRLSAIPHGEQTLTRALPNSGGRGSPHRRHGRRGR